MLVDAFAFDKEISFQKIAVDDADRVIGIQDGEEIITNITAGIHEPDGYKPVALTRAIFFMYI